MEEATAATSYTVAVHRRRMLVVGTFGEVVGAGKEVLGVMV